MCLVSLTSNLFENPLFLHTLVNIGTMHVFLVFITEKGSKEVSLPMYILRQLEAR